MRTSSELDRLFHQFLKMLADEVREVGRSINASHVNFTVTISGRPDGDLKLEATLGDYSQHDGPKGRDLSAIFKEYKRRKGYEEDQCALLLSAAGDARDELGTDIPF